MSQAAYDRMKARYICMGCGEQILFYEMRSRHGGNRKRKAIPIRKAMRRNCCKCVAGIHAERKP